MRLVTIVEYRKTSVRYIKKWVVVIYYHRTSWKRKE